MRIFTDLHIHSKYSRATSPSMEFRALSYYANIKGLTLLGTGDITHPKWFQEVKEYLVFNEANRTYSLRDKPQLKISFIPTSEVATVYQQDQKTRRIHHVVMMPDLETASQVNDALSKYGNLESDGRPTLSATSPELVEILSQISDEIEVFPAHAWTPWWSIFGSVSGFDSMEECYKDQVGKIHALETGLSSDPPMNWRVSALDKYTLLSNSDCHSPQPHRLGREVTVFELDEPSYSGILGAIRREEPSIIFTLETSPEYGKYHWTGHRACNVSIAASEALKVDNRCPKCHRRLTLGVEQRVESLADRPMGYKPVGAPDFKYMLPLHELIAAVNGEGNPVSVKVQRIYDKLIQVFGSEFAVTLYASVTQISGVAGENVAKIIETVREGSLKITPGYDGVYGRIVLDSGLKLGKTEGEPRERTLSDYM